MHLSPAYLDHLARFIVPGQRKILGLVAPPGAGKSTLAEAMLAAFPGDIQIVPMDGFHLANCQLARLGRSERKGAPDTFDAAGFASLMRRIKAQREGEIIYAPDFRRDLEEAVAGAIAVEAHTPLIITEGNYLLLDEGPWAEVRSALDEVWYLEVNDAVRQQRLLERHMRFGRSQAQALAWVNLTDEPNARRIAQTRHRADRVVPWDEEQA
ncbi:nucleoside/nucleotide kinase family protein [Rhodoferax ferrireducens]|uniref:nucleoside/nucleotide kinase family protein n=1 Tax=Rhodoferax ferrireducens TaxID=192843 RepID=UPI000E0CE01C|nr:nucleoside/nucleotide kinase family protein [Rhodoferax ferrireducens]